MLVSGLCLWTDIYVKIELIFCAKFTIMVIYYVAARSDKIYYSDEFTINDRTFNLKAATFKGARHGGDSDLQKKLLLPPGARRASVLCPQLNVCLE